MDPEQRRLVAARNRDAHWKHWGPYLSERQWGTVREDYSDDGNAWEYFGLNSPGPRLSLGRGWHCGHFRQPPAALSRPSPLEWKGCHPEGTPLWADQSGGQPRRRREEYHFYLDSTPTHSYLKYLYKYPQAAFPMTTWWRETEGVAATTWSTNLHTGAFERNRYFDVVVEYAGIPEDILTQVTVETGDGRSHTHVLPTSGSGTAGPGVGTIHVPSLKPSRASRHGTRVTEADLGERHLIAKTRTAPVHGERNQRATVVRL